ncbi:MAG: VWA domain-containing protein [Candidatus Margulisbacteria bacterium]|nr:VWA domain-containing protein [Candidatus Margulisiibacteriota bacterium]
MFKIVAEVLNSKKKEIQELLKDFYKNPYNKFGKTVLNQLRVLINQVRSDRKLQVQWGQAGGGSFMDFDNNRIVFDPIMISFDTLDIKQEILKLNFISLHEIIHKLITRYPEFAADMEEKKEVDGYFEMMALGALLNAVEDPRDNDYMLRKLPGSSKWQDLSYDYLTGENPELFGQPMKLLALKQALGHTPDFIIYTSELIKFWKTGQTSKVLPDRVRKLLDETLDAFNRAYKEQPKSLDEYEVQRSATESFKIVIEEIWKKGYSDMLDELKDLERARQQMLDESSRKDILDQLTPQEMDELIKAIMKAIQDMQNANNQQQGGQGMPMPGAGSGQSGQPSSAEGDRGQSSAPTAAPEKKTGSQQPAQRSDKQGTGKAQGQDAGKAGDEKPEAAGKPDGAAEPGKQPVKEGKTPQGLPEGELGQPDGAKIADKGSAMGKKGDTRKPEEGPETLPDDKSGQGQPAKDVQDGQDGAQTPAEIPKDWKGEIDWNKVSDELKEKLKQKAKENTLPEIENKLENNLNEAGKQLQDINEGQHKFNKPDKGKASAGKEATGEQTGDKPSEDPSGVPGKSAQGGTGGDGFAMQQDAAKTGPEQISGPDIDGIPDNIDKQVSSPVLNQQALARDIKTEPEISPDKLQEVQQKSREIINKLDEAVNQGDLLVSLNPYEQVLVKFADPINRLTTGIGDVLYKNKNPQLRYGYDSGNYISMEMAMQMQANPALYQIFGRETLPQEYDFEFLFFIDLSISMKDNRKIIQAFVGLTMGVEALERNSIKNSVIGFNYGQVILKDFEDNLSPAMRNRLSTIVKLPSGGTNDAEALEFGYNIFKQRPGTIKFMILLTDGGTGQPQKLPEVLGVIAREAVIPLPIALGFGPETSELDKHYPIALPNLSHEEFVEVFPPLLRDMMENPQQYLSTNSSSNLKNLLRTHLLHSAINHPMFDRYALNTNNLPFADDFKQNYPEQKIPIDLLDFKAKANDKFSGKIKYE